MLLNTDIPFSKTPSQCETEKSRNNSSKSYAYTSQLREILPNTKTATTQSTPFCDHTIISKFDIFFKLNLIFSNFSINMPSSFGGNHAWSINSCSRLFTSNINDLGRYGRGTREKGRQRKQSSIIELSDASLNRLSSISGFSGIQLKVLICTHSRQISDCFKEKFVSLANLTCNGPDFDCVMSESSV